MNKEREIISKELARTLHYLLTSYKLTVYGEENYDDEPFIEGLDSIKSFAASETDQFSLRASWVPLTGWEGDYRFSHYIKVRLHSFGMLELTNRDGETLKLQLWQKATFPDKLFTDRVNNYE